MDTHADSFVRCLPFRACTKVEEQPAGQFRRPTFLDWFGQLWSQNIGRHVSRFYFRICNGDYSGTSGEGFDLADRDAAWTEMTRVCGDLVGGIARKLKQQSEWRMALLDKSRKPVFRIRVVAETLDGAAASRIDERRGVDIGVKTPESSDPSSA